MHFSRATPEVLSEAVVAVTGADMTVLVNGRGRKSWESFVVKPGDVVGFRPAQKGVRAYLAVAGGINVPEVSGSRSTFLGPGSAVWTAGR